MLTMEDAMKLSPVRFAVGEIVPGTGIEFRPKEVLVDIGDKSEGAIPVNEFMDIDAVQVGGQVDVLIEKLEDKDGMVILSHEKAEFQKELGQDPLHLQRRRAHSGQGQGRGQGRPAVNVGGTFLPASQLDVTVSRISPIRGQHLRFRSSKSS
jgi:small subunit ribosomal protein S1